MFLLDVRLLPSRYRENTDWFLEHIPFFDCPDPDFLETYYFRWDVYRKHIRHTPDGYIITEFLPAVSWAGKHNSISASVSHHFYEGRWLRKTAYLDEYAAFWFQADGATPRSYSCWLADAIYGRYLVTGESVLALALLPALVRNYE